MPVKSRDRLLPAKVTKLNLLLSQYVLQQESELSPAAGLGYPKRTWDRRTVGERSLQLDATFERHGEIEGRRKNYAGT